MKRFNQYDLNAIGKLRKEIAKKKAIDKLAERLIKKSNYEKTRKFK